uniref:Uncharacterized protein n=1 Tax=Anguilla anguilla TaxID=7936 RepID=A0A0E9T9F4_ANGAN
MILISSLLPVINMHTFVHFCLTVFESNLQG